jgi:hypothetical protein
MELAGHALNGPSEEQYAALVEILEMRETELSLDDILESKLMQREQKLKLQAEVLRSSCRTS